MERLRVFLFLLLLFCLPCLSEGKTFFTHLGTLCAEDCKPDAGEYKCKSTDEDGKSQSMYCSPQENVDYWGRQCRADSTCAKYGEDYCWCRVNIFSWGFCGLVKEDQTLRDAEEDHHNTSPHRNRRDRKVVEVIKDDKIKTIIKISVEEAPGDFVVILDMLKKEAEELIDRWDNSLLVFKLKRIKSTHFRIGIEDVINYEKNRYINLQLRLNFPQGNTIVSQVLVPDGVPVAEHYIKNAFLLSLKKSVRVFIDISPM